MVGFCRNCRRGLIGVALCTSLAEMPASSQTNPAPESTERRPREVKPPRTPSEQGFQTALLFGINILPHATYGYNTRIILPDGQQLQYAGSQSAPGVTVFAGGSVTFPGALRRVTAGIHFNAGGLSSASKPVIPKDTPTPFSKQNLQNAVQNQHASGTGWNAGFSPYVEHEIWRLSEMRLRAGYQYWKQTGAYQGTFSPNQISVGGYGVELKHSSHMIRVSLNHSLYFNDSNGLTDTFQHAVRKSGLIRQIGVTAGTHKTIMLFFAIGPIWQF
jgi:hypothetical protein